MLLRPQAHQARPQNTLQDSDRDIIEISSDSEPEAKHVKQKIQSKSLSKKRTLSSPTNDPPSKRQLIEAAADSEVIELLDSDDDIIDDIPTIKAEPHLGPSMMIPISSKQIPPISNSELEEKPQIKLESTQSRSTTASGIGARFGEMTLFKLKIDESAKDSEGRYIVTKKVKVDSVEGLTEVPKRWPVPPEDTTVAYVINLNEDKRWRDGTSKEKAFDRFLKQEVSISIFPPGPLNLNWTNFII